MEEDELAGLDDDDKLGMAIADALHECFSEAAEDADPLVAQQAIVTFAITATHLLLYEAAESAREEKLDVQGLAQAWIEDTIRMISDGLTNQTLLSNTARLLEEPEIRLAMNRSFRRRLRR